MMIFFNTINTSINIKVIKTFKLGAETDKVEISRGFHKHLLPDNFRKNKQQHQTSKEE